jgi:undecaprenyl-diphosphatase
VAGINLDRLLEVDTRLSNKMRIAERPGGLRTFAALLAHSGDSWLWLLGLAALWLAGNEDWKLRAVILAIGIILTAVVVMTIKFTVRRKRPEGNWGSIYRSTDPHSFPSGHAARAVMLALVTLGGGPTWLAIVLIVWAPFVSLARVAMGLHYLSDVIAGIGFGLVIGLLMVAFCCKLM